MLLSICLIVYLAITVAQADVVNNTKLTRRIMRGREAGDTLPYMVYLRPTNFSDPKLARTNWVCGGAIIHEQYVLTSAACIEDASHFTVISGTHRWVPASETNDECINNGAKRAVWKCVPKSYYFDGNEFDNIRWMVGDIAVVKVEDDFNFERRIKGCEFIPKKVAFNNESLDFEKPGTFGTIAGWGTDSSFEDIIARSSMNSPTLKETDVALISKKNCKRRWDQRYHFLIDEHVICTKDSSDTSMSAACLEREVNCKELLYTDEDYKNDDDSEKETYRKMVIDPKTLVVHSASHGDSLRRNKIESGGFCQNDHGGPLVVGRGQSSKIVGVMSACQTQAVTQKCYGPFLYTSVYKYRNLITCAIDKEINPTCRKFMGSSQIQMSETTYDWNNINKKKENQSNTNNYEILTRRNFIDESQDYTQGTTHLPPKILIEPEGYI